MKLIGFCLVSSNNKTGDLVFKKDIFRLNFCPSLLPTTNHFVIVTKEQERFFKKTFDSIVKAIDYINSELCVSEY